MASANVELVRSILAAWERGTPSPAEWAHPEIEYVIVGGPSPGTWTGLAGMVEGFRDWLGAWKDLRFDVDHYRSSTTSACSCSFTTTAGERRAEWTSARSERRQPSFTTCATAR